VRKKVPVGIVEQTLAREICSRPVKDYPWNNTLDPYAIWVSEVMLQQTRVAAALPKYTPFIERFPAVENLAQASEQEVLKAWEGLGYYRRATSLWKAAKVVVEQHDGIVPSKLNEFRKLPGVGRYTAHAVLSAVHGEPLAAVDGNIRRILSRIYQVEEKSIWYEEKGQELLEESRNWGGRDWCPGQWNRAFMEFGQFICVRKPQCSICPLSSVCQACQNNVVENYPQKRAYSMKRQPLIVCIREYADGIFLQKRNQFPLNGLYDFPYFDSEFDTWESNVLARVFAAVVKRKKGIGPVFLGEFRHTVMKITYDVRVFLYQIPSVFGGENIVPKSRVEDHPLTGWSRKAWELYKESAYHDR
jgi:A/G-specific adenine glycosylase